MRRPRLLALAAALAALAAGGLAAPAGAALHWSTPDGSAFVFHTREALVAADTDTHPDAYRWSASGLQLLTPGPAIDSRGGVQEWGISADGSRVLLDTRDQLVPSDTDTALDIYLWENGTLTRIAPGAELEIVADASADMSRVFFQTPTPLVAADTDDDEDVYLRENGTTRLVSTSPPGSSGSYGHDLKGTSSDGLHVFEQTTEPLVAEDVDGTEDIYERFGSTVRLVSKGRLGSGTAAHHTGMAGIAWRNPGVSEDGSSAVFITNAPLEPGDVNPGLDLYQRRNGQTRLLTGTQNGIAPPCPGACSSGYLHGQSSDGAVVALSAHQRLTPDDQDDALDAFLWEGSSLTRLGDAAGTGFDLMRVAADGSRVVFSTTSGLVPEDTDGELDAYAREGGQTTLLTPGTASRAPLVDASRDTEVVLFWTPDSLVPGDPPGTWDMYVSDHGSIGRTPVGFSDHVLSADGSRIFYESGSDWYTWSAGTTTLITEAQP